MPERRFGVLIANCLFPAEEKLSPLRCPEADADGLKAALTESPNGLFAPDDVICLKNLDSHDILRGLDEVLRKAGREDLVLIFYSGHGKQNRYGKLHLATKNTSFNLLGSTSISVESLKALMETTDCNRIVMILDCCYSGLAGGAFVKGSVDDQLEEVSRGRGTYILTASTKLQPALERPEDEYSLMTKHLISGIRDERADRDEDGRITMDELYAWVHDRVVEEGAQEPERHALNVRGELVIARSSGKSREERRAMAVDMLVQHRKMLPRKVYTAALQVLEMDAAEITGRFAEYDRLLNRLAIDAIPLGAFVEEWYEIAHQQTAPPAPERVVSPASSKFAAPQAAPSSPRQQIPESPRPWRPAVQFALESEHRGHSPACLLSADGKAIILASDCGLEQRDLETWSIAGSLPAAPEPVRTLTSAGRWGIAGVTASGAIQIWHTFSERQQAMTGAAGATVAFSTDYPEQARAREPWDEEEERRGVLAIGDAQGVVKLRDGEASERVLQAHANGIRSLAFSPVGDLLATGSRDARVKLWDTRDLTLKTTLRHHRKSVLATAFSADGHWFAAGSADGSVSIWQTGNWSLAATLPCGEFAAEAVDISADGSLVVSATSDGTIRLWRRERLRYTPRFLTEAGVASREDSVAALPRLNCRIGGLKYEPPFVIGVLADVRGMPEEPPQKLQDRRFIDISADNFDAVLHQFEPRVLFKVPARIVPEEDVKLGVEIKIRRMRDFEPEAVVAQVPALRKMAGRREILAHLPGALSKRAADAIATAITTEATFPPPPEEWRWLRWTPGNLAAEAIATEFVRTHAALFEDGSVEAWRRWYVEFFQEMAENPADRGRDIEAIAARRVTALDKRLSLQLDEILHNPEFQKLEARWRGLEYLVSQAAHSHNVRIRLLDLRKSELLEDLRNASETARGHIFEKIYEDELGNWSGEPFSLMIADYKFGNRPEDLEGLEKTSAVAAGSLCPFITCASPELFNFRSFLELAGSRDPGDVFDTLPYVKWRFLRESEDAKFLTLTMPSILLRHRYRKESGAVTSFEYEESGDAPEKKLFGNAVWALAARLLTLHDRYGCCWPRPDGGGLADLPRTTVEDDNGDPAADHPAEIAVN